ncbi:hypothetical protein P2G88_00180 [Aliiglaciecola sp. CAU 1673]|uniref:hypothetical protein n=1 Tax=Aliiglaciecola sp. CAU 1673 TaxID=3032595 RepID=UPI0023DA4137|nr:hypothetical protein [Aliiglaciecola sp. CAU 1673]MDF2176663.1 hypothetical protein [Aliiglaciecola sp. CAU 1673]
MSALSFMFSAIVTLSVFWFLLVMGMESWVYVVVLPPLFFTLFIARMARLPRKSRIYDKQFLKTFRRF